MKSVVIKPNMSISIPRLISFIFNAKRNTYASGEGIVPNERIWIPGNKEHEYCDDHDDLYYRDSYCGYLSAPGMEFIKFGGEYGTTIWTMSYCGGMKPPFHTLTTKNTLFAHRCFVFLKLALQNVPEDMPLRGPFIFKHPDFPELTYEFHLFTGDFTCFSAAEYIKKDTWDNVFAQQISGGLAIYK